MKIAPFQHSHIPCFLELAEREGWVADSWEFEFLLAVFPQGCCCALGADGRIAGFVTSIRHDRSGWIGNLVVAEEHRGKGVGSMLFRQALETLFSARVRTVWLTASVLGKGLYEREGFRTIDRILRWSGSCDQKRHIELLPPDESGAERITELDNMTWGDRRSQLLEVTCSRGSLLTNDRGFLVLQQAGNACQLGPFSAEDSSSAEALLDQALLQVPAGKRVYLDAPARNREAVRMFTRQGMAPTGSSELMYAGQRPEYFPERLYGLATMGSCG